jgi:anaerobic ribonucleoside-triphosphate reductase
MVLAKISKKKIHEDIKREAKVLGLHSGTAEIIADKVTEKVVAWGKKRSKVTEEDLNDKLAKEIKKFNEDLAYLFESKDKII